LVLGFEFFVSHVIIGEVLGHFCPLNLAWTQTVGW